MAKAVTITEVLDTYSASGPDLYGTRILVLFEFHNKRAFPHHSLRKIKFSKAYKRVCKKGNPLTQ